MKYLLARAKERARLIWGLLRRAKVDGNARQLDDEFLACGATLVRLDCVGDDVPDRVVGIAGVSVLVEYKNPATRGKLSPGQEAFARLWRGGTVYLCEKPGDPLRLVNVLRGRAVVPSPRDPR